MKEKSFVKKPFTMGMRRPILAPSDVAAASERRMGTRR
jgi:hypothetical protein